MLTASNKAALGFGIALLVVGQALLQPNLDRQRHQFEPGGGMENFGKATKGLPIEFALGAVVGFREAVAGLLWVRADEFFHTGDYAAITPLVRIVTWLDPHQIDVYETGAWHMDYNFTDEDQRSDRRYVPLALALMKEGIKNNPTLPGMISELAFTHYYRKIEDYAAARYWFQQGQEQIDKMVKEAKDHPNDVVLQQNAAAALLDITTLSHGLAHADEGIGDIPAALKQWQYCLDMHEANIKNKMPSMYGETNSAEVARRQLHEMTYRAKWRKELSKDPVDMNFDAELIRVAPKVFVAKGQLNAIGSIKFVLENGPPVWGPANGARVEVRIQDADYQMKEIPSFSLTNLSLDPTRTILQDAASVSGGSFEKKLDMHKNPEIYSFKAPKYTVTFWFNPSDTNDTPPSIQDRTGWLGEGITDKRYLDTTGKLPGDIITPVPGLRYIRKTITLTRDDLLGEGYKVFK